MTTITDTIAGVLWEHRPVTGVMTKRLDGIVGCRCMNRVFFSGEDYPSHLAEVIAAAIEPEIRADECRKAAATIRPSVELFPHNQSDYQSEPFASNATLHSAADDLDARADEHEKGRA